MVSRRLILASGLALASSACTQLAFLAANVSASFGDYSQRRDLVYGPEPRHRLDVYLPPQPQGAPVLVFFHGGGWRSGDKDHYKFVGSALAELGYIAVLPNYRLYPQVRFPDFVNDAALAVAWVRQRAASWVGDAPRLYLLGHSAGAHIAMMLALNAQYLAEVGMSTNTLRGVVGLAGPYDFLPFKYDYMRDLFGPEARYPESQPIRYARADAPPLFLLQGLRDNVVAPANATHLADALTALGARVTVKLYPDANHGDLVAAFSIPARGRVPVLKDTQQFVDS